MRKIICLVVVISGVVFLNSISHAFFFGFGSAPAAEQVIKKGQEEGKIPKTPDGGETTSIPTRGLEVVWQKAYGSGNYDDGRDIAVDDTGNVYVTGFCTGAYSPTTDYLTIKYNSSGDIVWQKGYNAGDNDFGRGIAVDSSGNVYVTGSSGTIKYNGINGDTIWQKTYIGVGIAVDSLGNVYVAGDSTIKSNGTNGDTVWQKTYGGGSNDRGFGIAVDSSVNVYVTGYSSGANLTIKYDTNGNIIWQKVYNGGYDDYGYGIAVDSSNNVYVTGESYTSTGNCNYLTIKYSSNRDIVWQKVYGGGYVRDIAVDSSGNVYVTGSSGTIKYDSSGNLVWQENKCCCYGIAVDSSGYVYGIGIPCGGGYANLTTKYRQY